MFAGIVHGFFRHVGSGAAASCLKHPETRSEDSRCFDESCLMFRMEQPVVLSAWRERPVRLLLETDEAGYFLQSPPVNCNIHFASVFPVMKMS